MADAPSAAPMPKTDRRGEPPCEHDLSTCYIDCVMRFVCAWQRDQVAYWMPADAVAQAQHEAEIARMDWWNTLTDRERDDEIKKAM
jgi:hypothetical protein